MCHFLIERTGTGIIERDGMCVCDMMEATGQWIVSFEFASTAIRE